MGLDGGTIVSRTDVLRGASWRLANSDAGHRSTRGGQLPPDYAAAAEERVHERERREAAWTCCSLTGAPLQEPVVACRLGKLYNTESIVQFRLSLAGVRPEGDDKWLFDRLRLLKEQFSHISSRKDVFQLRFHTEAQPSACAAHAPTATTTASTPASTSCRSSASGSGSNSGSGSASGSGSGNGSGKAREDASGASTPGGDTRGSGSWVCPVMGTSLNGPYTCSALKRCGHVISDRALKQMRDKLCPVCSEAYAEDDVIRLNRPEDEVQVLRDGLKRKKGALGKSGKQKRMKVAKPEA